MKDPAAPTVNLAEFPLMMRGGPSRVSVNFCCAVEFMLLAITTTFETPVRELLKGVPLITPVLLFKETPFGKQQP